AVLTVPATYPPEPVAGVMVSGFDSPLATAIDGSFVHPGALYPEIARLVGRLPFADFQEIATGPGWHATALGRLLDGIARRTTLARTLLGRERWDGFMVVFGESDTVAHHFWRFHDPHSPRHAPGPFADAVRRVYEALDAALGELLAAAPADAAVAVVSDHGSGGAGDRVVHLNRGLAECGLLAFARPGPVARLAGAGRVWRREELYRGPFVSSAPDLLLELARVDGYTPSCLRSGGPGPAIRRLAPHEHGGGKGSGMNGSHRRHGLFVLAGRGVRAAG